MGASQSLGKTKKAGCNAPRPLRSRQSSRILDVTTLPICASSPPDLRPAGALTAKAVCAARLLPALGMLERRLLRLAKLGAFIMPKARVRVKGRKDPAVLLRSMAALLHFEAGAEDRPAAPVRQVMGAASHKADDGGPEGRYDAMRAHAAEPALTRGRCRIGPQFFPRAGCEQITPPGRSAELFAGQHAELAVTAGRQGYAAEKLAAVAAFRLRGTGRCGIMGTSKSRHLAAFLCPHRRQAGGFFIGHITPPEFVLPCGPAESDQAPLCRRESCAPDVKRGRQGCACSGHCTECWGRCPDSGRLRRSASSGKRQRIPLCSSYVVLLSAQRKVAPCKSVGFGTSLHVFPEKKIPETLKNISVERVKNPGNLDRQGFRSVKKVSVVEWE